MLFTETRDKVGTISTLFDKCGNKSTKKLFHFLVVTETVTDRAKVKSSAV